MRKIGFIGLGTMGAGMARNILKAGFHLTITTSSREKEEAFARDGAQIAANAGDLLQSCDVIVTCVPDGPALIGLFEGPLADLDYSGRLFIDCSTIAPDEARGCAAVVETGGGRFVDAPVSGGAKGAEAGTLTIMCGGDQSDFDAGLPVLQAMGKSITLFGPVGAGQAVKAANQLIVAVNMMGAFEAIAIARANGVDPEAMRAALMTGAARSGVLEMHAKRYLEDTLSGGFRVELLMRDLGIVASAGEDGGLSQPAAALALQMVRATCNAGFNGHDSAVLGRFYDLINNHKDMP
ncbi:MAG: 2-hydroxy-3-oxopropionate reductase [Tistrella sp.]|nr:2-hydroxy-3-oxopropionate reductase [Tistrella sp.]